MFLWGFIFPTCLGQMWFYLFPSDSSNFTSIFYTDAEKIQLYGSIEAASYWALHPGRSLLRVSSGLVIYVLLLCFVGTSFVLLERVSAYLDHLKLLRDHQRRIREGNQNDNNQGRGEAAYQAANNPPQQVQPQLPRQQNQQQQQEDVQPQQLPQQPQGVPEENAIIRDRHNAAGNANPDPVVNNNVLLNRPNIEDEDDLLALQTEFGLADIRDDEDEQLEEDRRHWLLRFFITRRGQDGRREEDRDTPLIEVLGLTGNLMIPILALAFLLMCSFVMMILLVLYPTVLGKLFLLGKNYVLSPSRAAYFSQIMGLDRMTQIITGFFDHSLYWFNWRDSWVHISSYLMQLEFIQYLQHPLAIGYVIMSTFILTYSSRTSPLAITTRGIIFILFMFFIAPVVFGTIYHNVIGTMFVFVKPAMRPPDLLRPFENSPSFFLFGALHDKLNPSLKSVINATTTYNATLSEVTSILARPPRPFWDYRMAFELSFGVVRNLISSYSLLIAKLMSGLLFIYGINVFLWEPLRRFTKRELVFFVGNPDVSLFTFIASNSIRTIISKISGSILLHSFLLMLLLVIPTQCARWFLPYFVPFQLDLASPFTWQSHLDLNTCYILTLLCFWRGTAELELHYCVKRMVLFIASITGLENQMLSDSINPLKNNGPNGNGNDFDNNGHGAAQQAANAPPAAIASLKPSYYRFRVFSSAVIACLILVALSFGFFSIPWIIGCALLHLQDPLSGPFYPIYTGLLGGFILIMSFNIIGTIYGRYGKWKNDLHDLERREVHQDFKTWHHVSAIVETFMWLVCIVAHILTAWIVGRFIHSQISFLWSSGPAIHLLPPITCTIHGLFVLSAAHYLSNLAGWPLFEAFECEIRPIPVQHQQIRKSLIVTALIGIFITLPYLIAVASYYSKGAYFAFLVATNGHAAVAMVFMAASLVVLGANSVKDSVINLLTQRRLVGRRIHNFEPEELQQAVPNDQQPNAPQLLNDNEMNQNLPAPDIIPLNHPVAANDNI